MFASQLNSHSTSYHTSPQLLHLSRLFPKTMPRIWFVTGSSKGLGLAIVEAALRDGDSVVATARKPETLTHLVEKYGSSRVLALPLDVTNVDQVESAVKAGLDRFGSLDIVVNNAGYADIAPLEDTSLESFRAQIEANLMGVVYVTKAVLPALRKQGSGRILQVSSVGGRLATPGLSAYQAAKWAVGGFSEVVQKEVASFGIKVTILEPGGIKTDWAGMADDDIEVSEPYHPIITQVQGMRKQYAHLRSEPAEMAQTILQISKVPDPPLRLLLGRETSDLVKKAASELAASDEKWKAATLLSI